MSEGEIEPLEHPAVGRDGLISGELACVICGYSVRGLRADGVCPECATPIERSLRSRLLRHASPVYVAALHRGAVAASLSVAGFIILPIVVLLISAALSVAGRLPMLFLWIYLPVGGLAVTGFWLLASPDPAARPDEPGEKARRRLRVVTLTLAGSVAAMVLLGVLRAAFGFPTAVAAAIGWIPALALGLSTIAWILSGLDHVRALAGRIPEPWLRRRAGLLLLLTIGIVVGQIGVVIAESVSGAGRPGAPAAPTGAAPPGPAGPLRGRAGTIRWVARFLGLATFIGSVLFIGMLDRLRQGLKTQRALAEAAWGAGGRPETGPVARAMHRSGGRSVH